MAEGGPIRLDLTENVNWGKSLSALETHQFDLFPTFHTINQRKGIQRVRYLSVFLFIAVFATQRVPAEDKYVDYQFDDMPKATQDLVKELDAVVSGFAPGCSDANDAAWKAWAERFIDAPGDCALSIASAITFAPHSRSASVLLFARAAVVCTVDHKEAIDAHFRAKKNLLECKQATDLLEKYKEHCNGKSRLIFSIDKTIYCFDADKGGLLFLYDIEKKTFSVKQPSSGPNS